MSSLVQIGSGMHPGGCTHTDRQTDRQKKPVAEPRLSQKVADNNKIAREALFPVGDLVRDGVV